MVDLAQVWRSEFAATSRHGPKTIADVFLGPDRTFLEGEPLAQIALALLEKPAVAVSEICYRTGLSPRGVHRTLIKYADEFGNSVVLISPSGKSTQLGQVNGTEVLYSHVGRGPNGAVGSLGEYVKVRLAARASARMGASAEVSGNGSNGSRALG